MMACLTSQLKWKYFKYDKTFFTNVTGIDQ